MILVLNELPEPGHRSLGARHLCLVGDTKLADPVVFCLLSSKLAFVSVGTSSVAPTVK